MEKGILPGKAPDNALKRKLGSLAIKISEWLPHNDSGSFMRSPHFWIITALTAVIAFFYYIDQTPLADLLFFNHSFFTGVHDLQRILFFIPVIYTALIFRVRGSLISSFAFLCIVLPRALMFSPYPDPILRSLFFVAIAVIISSLIATELNRVEKESKSNAELKAAYQKLRESQEKLIQVEKMACLGQMAASIAHEVNNPLAGILAYTQLLIRRIENHEISKEEALSYLSKIEMETTRSGTLLRGLLEFSHQAPPVFSPVKANDAVERALDLAIHSSRRKNIKVVKKLSKSLPVIMADGDKLHQVFTNLILNAIQAMPRGGTLTIHTSARGRGKGIKVEIKDTGCGIPPENIPKLFTPFFTTKREVQGVGLGLSVSYGIIECHKGEIEVHSEQGKGSTFTVYLPLNKE